MSTSQFSGAVKLSTFDDFIAPSLECIVPLNLESRQDHVPNSDSDGARVHIALESSTPTPVRASSSFAPIQGKKVAKITLNDCLACSGCLTSAETVLVEQHSANVLVRRMQEASFDKLIVTISSQSRAALSHHYHLTPLSTMCRLSTFFHDQFGASLVIDTSVGVNVAMLEAQAEFMQRYASQSLPLIASECPGWTVYAEKTHGELITPYMSSVRSPQQIMGVLVKQLHTRTVKNNTHVDAATDIVFHLSVTPCFDKKLEAARPLFFDKENNIHDVDLVLATNELIALLQERGVDALSTIPERNLDHHDFLVNFNADKQRFQAVADGPGASGGYLENIFRHAAKNIFGVVVDDELHYIAGRNPDLKEVHLVIDGEIRLRFAAVYGFRNIQNLVRKMKCGTCKYDYVEVLACPAGCLNGGAQFLETTQRAPALQRQRVSHIAESYFTDCDKQTSDVSHIYQSMVGDGIGSDSARQLFHTKYQALSSSNASALTSTAW